MKGGTINKHTRTTGVNPTVSLVWVPGEQAHTHHPPQTTTSRVQEATENRAEQANLVSWGQGRPPKRNITSVEI